MDKKKYDLLVIGELCVDLILTGNNLQPDFGQAEKLVEDANLVMGSSTAIMASGAAKLGLSVGFIGAIGNDTFGNFMKRALEEKSISTAGVYTDQHGKTGITVHLSQPEDRAMLTYAGTMATFSFDQFDHELLNQARHVHLSSYFLQPNLTPDLPEIFRIAHRAGATTSIDPGWDPSEGWDSGIQDALKWTDWFLPNETEARSISGQKSTLKALEFFRAICPGTVIKCGRKGVQANYENNEYHIEPFMVRAVDTTGAGDNFNAGFLYGFLNGWEIGHCIQWGNACGALATLAVGGTSGQKTALEVREWIQNH